MPVRPLPMLTAVSAVLLSAVAFAQEQAPDVSPLVVTPAAELEVPVPKVGEGAPQFTPAEIKVIQEAARKTETAARIDASRCLIAPGGANQPTTLRAMIGQAFAAERDAAMKVMNLSAAAVRASEEAERVRRAAARGRADEKDVIDSELKRQRAVNALVVARNDLSDVSASIPVMQALILDLDMPSQEAFEGEVQLPSPFGQPNAAPTRLKVGDTAIWEREQVARIWPQVMNFRAGRAAERLKKTRPPFADLKLEAIVVRETADARGRFLSVSGKVVNTRPQPVNIPSLEFTQYDSHGFVLDQVVADSSGRQIAPSEAAPFRYDFRPKADRADSLRVTLTSTERLPPRLPAGMMIAPTLPGEPGERATRGVLAGDQSGLMPGMAGATYGTADCSA